MINMGILLWHWYTRMNLWDGFETVFQFSSCDLCIKIASWGKYRDAYHIVRWLYRYSPIADVQEDTESQNIANQWYKEEE